MSSNVVCPVDPTSVWRMKECMDVLLRTTTMRVNESFSLDIFLGSMRVVIVTPLKPSLDCYIVTNYEPVSHVNV